MGREARRVPLDFDWPQGQVWEGYLTPDRLREDRCPDCENGMTADGELIQGIAYMIVGLADDVTNQARGRQMHPYLAPIQEILQGARLGREVADVGDHVGGTWARPSLVTTPLPVSAGWRIITGEDFAHVQIAPGVVMM